MAGWKLLRAALPELMLPSKCLISSKLSELLTSPDLVSWDISGLFHLSSNKNDLSFKNQPNHMKIVFDCSGTSFACIVGNDESWAPVLTSFFMPRYHTRHLGPLSEGKWELIPYSRCSLCDGKHGHLVVLQCRACKCLKFVSGREVQHSICSCYPLEGNEIWLRSEKISQIT